VAQIAVAVGVGRRAMKVIEYRGDLRAAVFRVCGADECRQQHAGGDKK
jgi:hypothetical protein